MSYVVCFVISLPECTLFITFAGDSFTMVHLGVCYGGSQQHGGTRLTIPHVIPRLSTGNESTTPV